ncbi:MAG: sugar ABC transporter ATP-binding protein [Burkholderiales bacterium]
MNAETPVIELRGIGKRFGAVEVLSGIDMSLYAGRVHALAGENGAGKSTIVKILGGINVPDGGRIFKGGQEITIDGVTGARRHGIAVIHQHPALFPDLSVAENIFVGRQPLRYGAISWAAMQREARELLNELQVDLDVRLPVKMLGIAERQTVEIVKALSLDARVLVMDEPTSAVSREEAKRLFEIAGALKAQGVAVLFISHFIDEILGFGDDVTVLRSGRRIITAPAKELTPESIVRHMVGRAPSAYFAKEEAQPGKEVLSVQGLCGCDFVEDVSFSLRAGEILGFFGLVGAGRSEVARMLFGIDRPDAGEIRIDGRGANIGSPREAMAMGISLLPEDRHLEGLVLEFPIRANATLPILDRLVKWFGLVDRERDESIAQDYTKRMQVVATGIEQLTNALSGGNQQKVLLAKWLIPSPRILILDEPTRGIDVGAKAQIHRIISHLATQGMAIILISDDAPEVKAMADRTLVFRGGRVVAQYGREAADSETMVLAAAHFGQDAAASMAAGARA